MERTTSLIIYTVFAIVGVAMIVLFISQYRPYITNNRNTYCKPEPDCTTRSIGETFCNPENTVMYTCVTDEQGCMQKSSAQCNCVVEAGIAKCS